LKNTEKDFTREALPEGLMGEAFMAAGLVDPLQILDHSVHEHLRSGYTV
jgi:hypothetical protein